jgi:hypothetical protein
MPRGPAQARPRGAASPQVRPGVGRRAARRGPGRARLGGVQSRPLPTDVATACCSTVNWWGWAAFQEVQIATMTARATPVTGAAKSAHDAEERRAGDHGEDGDDRVQPECLADDARAEDVPFEHVHHHEVGEDGGRDWPPLGERKQGAGGGGDEGAQGRDKGADECQQTEEHGFGDVKEGHADPNQHGDDRRQQQLPPNIAADDVLQRVDQEADRST